LQTDFSSLTGSTVCSIGAMGFVRKSEKNFGADEEVEAPDCVTKFRFGGFASPEVGFAK